MSTFARDPKPGDSRAGPDRPVAEHYRLFIVNSADRFQGVQVHMGASDTDALERARSVLEHHPYAAAIEVWKRGVLVGRIDR
jgi:hypothetical protein